MASAESSSPSTVTDPVVPPAPEDPWLYLEEVTGEKPLAWVRERNSVSTGLMAGLSNFAPLQERILKILDSKDKIPAIVKHATATNQWYYNLWKDASNPRGLWRRTTLDEYRKDSPQWETVLDLDQLGKDEGENWVWAGSHFLEPANERALVYLSRGGADANVMREFDVVRKRFIPASEGGFTLPEAKNRVYWRPGGDSLFVGTVFPGEETTSLTDSGYPRVIKLWRRNTPLAEAEPVYAGETGDVSVAAYSDLEPGFERDFVQRGVTFWTNDTYYRDSKSGALVKFAKQDDAEITAHREYLLFELRSDWELDGKKHLAGSLLVTNFDAFLAYSKAVAAPSAGSHPPKPPNLEALFTPTPRKSLAGFSPTRNHITVNELDNVRNRVYVLTPEPPTSTNPASTPSWTRRELTGFPAFTTVSVSPVDPEHDDAVFLTVAGYLTPSSMYLTSVSPDAPPAEKLKQTPGFFNSEGLEVAQYECKSDDGTVVPYFQVSRTGLKLDGQNRTLLYGYGGFEIPMVPGYQATTGSAWLERGGVYVVANIRGGGEFGPTWHQAALKSHRHLAYEDFTSVAKDLVRRGVTSPKYLGCMGGSNGGLLVGNMYTTYGENFGAVVCQVPLLDMRRFSKLLAGASWMAEYGNPDTSDWSFIESFSPYHLTEKHKTHPPILFYTSTRDDRVHPAHARKMVARMLNERGVKEGFDGAMYYENIEGGHGGAADNKQSAFMSAMGWEWLWKVLKGDEWAAANGKDTKL
ncbi:hypothetical protein HDU93_000729 [Gonapodya sp. JEL0774]|nr:hypothetical protein HDU93_000729 [Gonapodya sp. JEL0774]